MILAQESWLANRKSPPRRNHLLRQVNEQYRILSPEHFADVLSNMEADLYVGSGACLKGLGGSPFVIRALNEAEKIPRTEHIGDDLLPIGSGSENIDQTAGHPKQQINGSALEEDESAAAIADDRGLFEQFLDDALRIPA